MNDPALLLVVRHGETAANTGGVWHGSTDTPLSERGHLQAARVGAHVADRYPDVRRIFTSPLQRARHTAEAIGRALSLEPQPVAELSEFDRGSWEGKTYQELHETHRLWHNIKRDPHFAPHGGESPRQVTDRLTGALRDIADRHPGEQTVVVAHGGSLSMAFAELIDGDYSQWRGVMGNCALSELSFGPAPVLGLFDQQEHLEGI